MKILHLLVIRIILLDFVYGQTVKGAAPPPTTAPKLSPNVQTTLKPNTLPSNFAPQFAHDVVTYVEGTTEEPFLKNKKLRSGYGDEIFPYFRQYGIINCGFAFCENLENGRKEFKKVPSNAGATISTCHGKLFYVSYSNITAAETWQQCCQYGMIPATFTSKEEFDCFNSAYHKFTGGNKKSSHKLITAYMDANLDSRYISCHTMKSLPNKLWCRKEPDNGDWRQAVLGFSVAEEGFSDFFLQERFYVVCENVPASITSIPQKISDKVFNTTNVNGRYSAPVAQELWKLHIPYCKNAFCSKEIPLKVPSDNNNLRNVTACKKILVISKIPVTYTTAWEECCKMGMTPLSIESIREMKCLRKFLYPGEITEDIYYITTVIDVNLNGLYSSCLSRDLLRSEMWAAEHPKKNEACVQFVMGTNKANLVSSACNSKATLVCEKKLETYSTYQAQLHNEQKIAQCENAYCKIDPSKMKEPIGLVKVKGINKTYYTTLGKDISYNEYWDTCCSNGLVPLSIDSLEELLLLAKIVTKPKNVFFKMFTGIIDIDLDQTFASCVTGKKLEVKIPWKGPRFLGPCTNLLIDDNGAYLQSLACNTKMDIACQSTPNISAYFKKPKFSALFESSEVALTSLAAPVAQSEAAAIKTLYVAAPLEYFRTKKLLNCESCVCKGPVKNPNAKTEKLKEGNLLEFQCETKQLYLLKVKVPYDLVWEECCALGLVPAAIENKQLLTCLAANYFKNVPTFGNVFWTSQIDSTLNRSFTSCASKNAVQDEVWLKGEPDNVAMREACVVIKFDNNSAGLQDLRCGEMLPVLCEMKAKFSLSTGVTNGIDDNSPYLLYKNNTMTYSDDAQKYLKIDGLYNCTYAMCNDMQKGKKLYDNAKPNEGLKIKGCFRRNYFVIYKSILAEGAWRTCCGYGLKPMTVNFKEEIECVYDRYIQKGRANFKYAHVTNIDSQMDHRFISCETGRSTPHEVWRPGEPNNGNRIEACGAIPIIKMDHDVVGMADVNCQSFSAPAICEIPDAADGVHLLAQDEKYLKTYGRPRSLHLIYSDFLNCGSFHCKNKNEKVMNIKSASEFKSFTGCGKMYYYRKSMKEKMINWFDAVNLCCSYGLTVVSIDSLEELTCLQKGITDGEYLFATASIDWYLDEQFASCLTGKQVPKQIWKSGHPRKIGACTSFELGPKESGLLTSGCGKSTNYDLMCQVPNNISDIYVKPKFPPPFDTANAHHVISILAASTTSAPIQDTVKEKGLRYTNAVINEVKAAGLLDCTIAVCNKIEEGKKYFRSAQNLTGMVITQCENKVYYLTDVKVTLKDIWQICCKIGMTPLSLSSKKEKSCLQNAYASKKGKISNAFWTSHVDFKMDMSFTSCVTGQDVVRNTWQGGEPNNVLGEEIGGFLSIVKTNGVNDGGWTLKYPVICETTDLTVVSPNKKNETVTSLTTTQGTTQKALTVTTKPVATIKSG